MTIIKRLRLKGFKSFAKPLDIEFGTGFNMVLGANGSGKSNIMDALCFVLGKLSAKSMRAEKSANLIFNGGKKGSPLKDAEVSIFFDNQNNEFSAIKADEVKFTRIIKNSGSSVYKINDETRTRQQLLELLSAAKINPDGHNIILQGDIIRFMDMHPEDRRELIEEIAGISVYEDRKHKALNELEKVESKLNETSIIMTERETYLRELKKERDQALKYKELEKNVKRNKATYLKMQVDERDAKRKEVEDRIAKRKAEAEKITKKIEEGKKNITQKRDVLERINKDIEEKGEKESIVLQKDIEELNKTVIQKSERLNTCQNEIQKIGERRRQLQISIQDVEKTMSDLEKTRESSKKTTEELQRKLERADKELSKFKSTHNVSEIAGIEKVEKAIDKELIEIQRLRERHQEVLQKKFQVDAKVAHVEEQLQSARELEKKSNIGKKREQYEQVQRSLGKRMNELSVVEKQLDETKQKLFPLEGEVFKLRAHHTGIKESVLGDRAVKRILELRDKQVYGTVSQLGRVDKKSALALEVAAGARMKSIVVEDDKKAAECIQLLKRERLGIATFLPLNKIKPRQKVSASGAGVHGNAMDLVSFDNKFKNVFSYVFGNTIVVSDIHAARRLGVGRYRMVTLEGDVVEMSGAMVGGFRTKARGIGFQEKEVGGDLANKEKEVSRLQVLKKTLEKRQDALEKDVKETSTEKHSLEGELVRLEKTLDVDLSKLEKERDRLQDSKIFNDAKELEKEIEQKNKTLVTLKEEREKVKKNIKDIRNPEVMSSLEKLESRRQNIREEIVQAQAEMKNVHIQLENIYKPEKEKTVQIIKQHEKEMGNFKKEQQELERTVKQQNEFLRKKEGDEKVFQKQYRGLFTERNKVSDEIRKIETLVATEDVKLREVNNRMNDLSIKRAKVVAELEGLNKEFEEFIGVALRTHISFDKLKDEIRRFERLLVEMGNVNLKALEVYEDIRKEYEKILEKVDRLRGEKEDVLEMMMDIESKKKDVFLKTFGVLEKNFTKIFSSLSTKGEASLVLENKEDPLSAGVEIRVRIIGNKFLDIKSLSGGEKTLAALAFIFAIQEHQPASFYLLDEVDAALDKKNSDLLSKLVARYSETAQYILISHNDQIISEAEYIYGVSMQESGMSKLVSLKV